MPKVITLRCPSCGGQVRIPEKSDRFSCDYCGNQHMLQHEPAPASATADAPAAPKPIRPRMPMPTNIRVLRDKESARIVRRWWSPVYIPMALFAVVWNGFLLVWYATVAASGAPLIFSVFPLVHVGVGLFVGYTTLAGFVNRTVVELTREELAVWHEPLPWGGEKTIKTADIKQLYCKEHVKRSKNGPRVTYELFAVTQDDLQIKLLPSLESPDLAQFFEQQLESWMKIADQPVYGELTK
jgi:DNA-directed RNA polymerase subunit RPC12/RpoP